jgi:hypothetical protein
MIMGYIIIAILLLVIPIQILIDRVGKKKKDTHIITALGALNKLSVEIEHKGEEQEEVLEREREILQGYIKRNEMVLLGVRERTVELWAGHNNLDEILQGVFSMEEQYGTMEAEEKHYLDGLRRNNHFKKTEIERWFATSFRMSVIDYIKQTEGINRNGFSDN